MKKLIASLVALAPAAVMAQTTVITNATSLATRLQSIGNTIISLLIAFAVIWIVISVVRFIMASGEERAEKRSSILWGVVGLAVILCIWGLVAILTNTFGTDNAAPVNQFPTTTWNPPAIQ